METLTSAEACARVNTSEISILSQKTGQPSHSFRKFSHQLNAGSGILDDKGAECQGFSIREYVGKMRSLNIRKCWPFSEGLLEDGLIRGGDKLLPPIHRPCNKSCACQNCAGEERELETSVHKSQLHDDPPENNLGTADGTIDPQMTICLSPCSEADLNISKDLEEQIRKLRTVQISGQDESGTKDEDSKQITEAKHAGSDVDRYGQCSFGRQFSRSESWSIETLDRTSQSPAERKPTGAHTKEPPESKETATGNRDGKLDTALCKLDSIEESPGRSCRFDLTESDCQLFMDVGIRQETEKGEEVAGDQVLGGSVSKQSERSKIENLNSQAIKMESVTQRISDTGNDEVSAVKICPVCKTFSSATVTAVNAHIDDCLAQASQAEKRRSKMQNHRPRKQKKRSIADICAAATKHSHLNDFQKLERIESDIASTAPNCKLNQTIGKVQIGLASPVCDDLPSFKCKRKRANRGNSLVGHGISGNGGGAAGSLDTKRKLPRLGMIPIISKGLEDRKIQLAASHCSKIDHGVKYQLKHSSIEEESRDLNFKRSQITEVNQIQNCDFLTNYNQLSGKLMDHIYSVCMLPKEERAMKDIISNCSRQVDEGGMLLEDDNTVVPSSTSTMATSATDIPQSRVMSVTKSLTNDLPTSNNEKFNIWGDDECRHHKIYSTQSTRMHVEETSKREDPNLLSLSDKSPVNKKLTFFNPGKAEEAQKSNGIYDKLECSVLHSFKEDSPLIETEHYDQDAEPAISVYKFAAKTDGMNVQVEDTKTNLGDCSSSLTIQSLDREKESCMNNVRVIQDSSKIKEEGHSGNIQLDLNKKVCVIPRDSKGRFLSSHIMDGDKDDSLYTQWNHAPRYKSTKSPRSLPNSSVKKKKSYNVEAHLSEIENARDHANLSLYENCSDNGYIGSPLDSEEELVKPISYTGQLFNQLYKAPKYTVSNEPLVSQGTHRDFNFVERSKTCHDATLVNQPLQAWSSKYLPQEDYSIQFKQPDYQQEYSLSNNNQSNSDKGLSEHSSLPEKNRTDKMLCRSPSFGIATSSIASLDAFSMFSIQSNVQSEYQGDQNEKASLSENIHPQVDISKRKQSTAQPVMRLMGQSFTIGGENEFKGSSKHSEQCNTKDTVSRSPIGAPTYVPSTIQRMTGYSGCTACNTRQLDLPGLGGNTLCPHCKVKANTSKSIQHNFKVAQSMGSMECIACNQDRTLDNYVPKPVERNFSPYYVHGHSSKQQSDSDKAWISNPLFSAQKANMLISPVKALCNKPDLNKGRKMKYKDSHVSKWDCAVQKQTCRQLLDSCLEKCTLQKQESNGHSYTSTSCPPQIYSDVCKPLSRPIGNSGNFSVPPHSFTGAIAHSTYFPLKKQYHSQTPSSYSYIVDSPTSVTPEKYIYSSLTSDKTDEQTLKFPRTTTIETNDSIHQKMGVTDVVYVDRKSRGNSKTGEFAKETKELLGKGISEKREDCWTTLMEKSHTFSRTEGMHKRKRVIRQEIYPSNIASKNLLRSEKIKNNKLAFRHSEILGTNNSRIEPSSDGGNSSSKVENESGLNVTSHARFSQKCLEKESELFMKRKPDNKCREAKASTGSSLKFTEPKKLIGGMKHTLKPFSINGNGKQFLPYMHFTLPFAETSGEERNENWKM